MVKQLKPDEAFSKLGLSVIPTDTSSKKALVPWKEFQDRKPTVEELQQWNQQHKGCAWAAITGKVSNAIALDFDQPEGPDTMRKLGLNPHIQTPSGGYHVYVEHPGFLVHTLNGKSKAELGKLYPGMDIKGDGGYALFYSSNPDRPYTKLRDLELIKFSSLPTDLRSYLEGSKDKPDLPQGEPSRASLEHILESNRPASSLLLSQALESVRMGEGRNNAGFGLAIQLRDNGYTKDEAYPVMRDFKDTCPGTNTKGEAEPYTDQEIDATLRQAYDREPREPWDKGKGLNTTSVESTEENEENSPQVLFPAHVISGLAGEYADLYARVMEAPREAWFMCFLACLGSLISGHVHINSEQKIDPRLYTLILGKSGSSRKSTTIDKTEEFFNESLEVFNVCKGVNSAEGMMGYIGDKRKELSISPKSPINILLSLDEFKALTAKMKIEGSVLLTAINTFYEGNSYESHTKKSHFRSDNTHLSLLGASTIDTYESMFDSEMMSIGLTNRITIVPIVSKRREPNPPAVNPVIKADLQGRLRAMVEAVIRDNTVFSFTAEANSFFHDWYLSLEQSIHSIRLDTNCKRFMLILAVNAGKTEIDLEIVRMACAFCDWQLLVRKLHSPIDADGKVARMEERIRTCLEVHGTLLLSVLKSKMGVRKSGAWTFLTAVANLEKLGDVKITGKTITLL